MNLPPTQLPIDILGLSSRSQAFFFFKHWRVPFVKGVSVYRTAVNSAPFPIIVQVIKKPLHNTEMLFFSGDCNIVHFHENDKNKCVGNLTFMFCFPFFHIFILSRCTCMFSNVRLGDMQLFHISSCVCVCLCFFSFLSQTASRGAQHLLVQHVTRSHKNTNTWRHIQDSLTLSISLGPPFLLPTFPLTHPHTHTRRHMLKVFTICMSQCVRSTQARKGKAELDYSGSLWHEKPQR